MVRREEAEPLGALGLSKLTCEAHPLAAHEASVFLRFGGVALAFFTARGSYRRRARSSRLAYNYIKGKKREGLLY